MKDILIIGDLMLDRYLISDHYKISPELPLPIAKISKIKDSLGGAGNVAYNISSLNKFRASIIGSIGNDIYGLLVKNLLTESKIDYDLIPVEETTLKTRIVHKNQHILRIDQDFVQKVELIPILKNIDLRNFSYVVLSDYSKGVLCKSKEIIDYIKKENPEIKVIVDPKNTNFYVYSGSYLITPNSSEFYSAIGYKYKGDNELSDEVIINKARSMIRFFNIKNILITRSEHGMLLITENESYKITTEAKSVTDVTGAGDTVVAILTSCLILGYNVVDATYIANKAAGIVVSKFGTSSLSESEFDKVCNDYLNGEY